ncbi:MAG: hypothetical protein KDA33_03110 [Phycisphaerales bacterium]|nr:hypothetical protein [Phycisphaerales bacterium]
MTRRSTLLIVAILLTTLFPPHPSRQARAAQPSATSQPANAGVTSLGYPNAGDLKAEVARLRARLETAPDDDNARLRLGFVEFFRGIEATGQSLHHYGLRTPIEFVPMPFEPNLSPSKITYQDTRRIVENWLESLNRAESTLSKIRRDDVAITLDVADITLDLDSDGVASSWENLDGFMRMRILGAKATLVVRLDLADAHWLRAYCHVLAGICEFALAHEWKNFFEHAGQLLFEEIETPYPFLRRQTYGAGPGAIPPQLIDIIAGVHEMRFDVIDPERMKASHAHFKAAIRQSREMWSCIMKETDNHLEWIPSPKQTGVLPIPVTQPMVDNWTRLLDEADALLDGRKLLPFWRDGESRGVNLRRVFTEPRPFDIVLWAQGTAAAPYLEKGEITSDKFWNDIQSAFGNQLSLYALWIN